jgi:hypothetical protein
VNSGFGCASPGRAAQRCSAAGSPASGESGGAKRADTDGSRILVAAYEVQFRSQVFRFGRGTVTQLEGPARDFAYDAACITSPTPKFPGSPTRSSGSWSCPWQELTIYAKEPWTAHSQAIVCWSMPKGGLPEPRPDVDQTMWPDARWDASTVTVDRPP